VLRDCTLFVELGRRKTVTVYDVMYALKRKGKPVWGFDVVSKQFLRKRLQN
jgi:histone H4